MRNNVESKVLPGEVFTEKKEMEVGDVLNLSSCVDLQLGGGLVRKSITTHTVTILEVQVGPLKPGFGRAPIVVVKIEQGNLRHEFYKDGKLTGWVR